MISALAAMAAAGSPIVALSWEGTAEVYPPGRTLKIAVRSSIDREGNVLSESWPIELGEAKGIRRMTLSASGGTMERAGVRQAMPPAIWSEERAQFGFYRQLQVAAAEVAQLAGKGVDTFSVEGEVKTWFRIGSSGELTGAINEVPTPGGTAWQQFRFDGFWRDDGAVFPKHMEMTRDGRPYFTLDVTRFDAR
jgi:hypothetical protein